MGDDDMFSSDLSEDQLRQRLGHMSTTQCQVCCSASVCWLSPKTIILLSVFFCPGMIANKRQKRVRSLHFHSIAVIFIVL
jgi:hypothetical protein